MPLILELGNVLDAQTDAVLLTVDGMARNKPDPERPIRGGREILGGNVANQFAKRWPEDWADMHLDLPFPIPIGRSVGVRWDGEFPWQLVILASTLHHIGVSGDVEKLAVIRAAFAEALLIAQRHHVKSLATVALTGGWRLLLPDAVNAMFAAYRQAGQAAQQIRLVLRVLSQDEFDLLASVARQHGLLV